MREKKSMEKNTESVAALSDGEFVLSKKDVQNLVRTTSGLEYVQTEVQRRWLSWQFVTRYKNKHSYAGTVPAKVKAERRAKNKVAKASRKANR
jgi:hypothetical protein